LKNGPDFWGGRGRGEPSLRFHPNCRKRGGGRESGVASLSESVSFLTILERWNQYKKTKWGEPGANLIEKRGAGRGKRKGWEKMVCEWGRVGTGRFSNGWCLKCRVEKKKKAGKDDAGS